MRDVVEQFYGALARKDAAAVANLVDEHFDPEMTLRVPPSLPHGGTWKGAGVAKRIFTAAAAADAKVGATELRVERIAEMAVEGEDQVVVELGFDWIVPETGTPATGPPRLGPRGADDERPDKHRRPATAERRSLGARARRPDPRARASALTHIGDAARALPATGPDIHRQLGAVDDAIVTELGRQYFARNPFATG